MSRDGAGPCCGDVGSIALAESTSGSGRRAGISFHNGGYDEGNLVLEGSRDGSGRGRRLVAYDNQGQGMRIEANDFFIRDIGQWASGINKFAGGYGVNAYVAYNVCGQGASVEYWNSPNPYTGGYSCPAGYADMRLTKIQYCLHNVGTMSYEMHLCYR